MNARFSAERDCERKHETLLYAVVQQFKTSETERVPEVALC